MQSNHLKKTKERKKERKREGCFLPTDVYNNNVCLFFTYVPTATFKLAAAAVPNLNLNHFVPLALRCDSEINFVLSFVGACVESISSRTPSPAGSSCVY